LSNSASGSGAGHPALIARSVSIERRLRLTGGDPLADLGVAGLEIVVSLVEPVRDRVSGRGHRPAH
jgi:hypothetical protein